MKIIYGADYNPEQWDKKIWLDDMKYMKEASVNMVNLNIFGWSIIEPKEGCYDFSMLDELMDLLFENGIDVDLATATAAQPAWLSKQYKDILPKDQQMNTIWYGSRQSYCPNSARYKEKVSDLVETIAKRYKSHPALKMWHINNEYSDHLSSCYCDNCAREFREWLKGKYSLIDLNERWGTAFWSQRYYDFDEIIPPRQTSADHNPGLVLDYKRFMSDSFFNLYQMEYKILKSYTPNIEVTTNFMGNDNKPLDYYKWAQQIDVISWDSYPDPLSDTSPMSNAFTHDLMRSLKSKPYIMMEQAPNQVNWRSINPNKKPGEMATYSIQCIAHGGVGVMFFQWRQSLKGAEKFHSGMIPHGGTNTRTFKEIVNLGDKLSRTKSINYQSNVAIYMDYDCWWALEYEPGPSSKMKYMDRIREYYAYFYNKNIPVDIVFDGSTYEEYDNIIVPNLYMLKSDEKFRNYVKTGGKLIVGPFSGIVDESDTVFYDGYMSSLEDVFGMKVIGYNVLENTVDISGKLVGRYWQDEILLNGAEALHTYKSSYNVNKAAVTKYNYGNGTSYYIGTSFKNIDSVLDGVLDIKGIPSPRNIEIIRMENRYIIINHNNESNKIKLEGILAMVFLEPYEYKILEIDN
jgi:beta-galactosidase